MAVRVEAVPRRGAIPSTQLPALRRAARRTTLLRLALGLVLVAALGAAVAVARGHDVRHAPLLPSGTTGIVVLDLSASIDNRAYRRVGHTMRTRAAANEPAGLVVVSDVAYELLPPGSPARELESLLREAQPVV
jgi:hypothetical protein